jgi:hypothetical protein
MKEDNRFFVQKDYEADRTIFVERRIFAKKALATNIEFQRRWEGTCPELMGVLK